MKLARIIIAILFCFFTTTMAQAEEFTLLVVPNCSVSTIGKNCVGNVNIEELLARKFIHKLENSDIAYAPTLQAIKISIKNNPTISVGTNNPMGNIKTLSNLYGVPNVLLVSSRTEVQASSEQKDFWAKLDLPVISQPEANLRIITTITLYNTKNNEVVWSDVYYQKIAQNSNNKNDNEKISFINSYYDELIDKAFSNMRATKETHAIRVTSQNQSKGTVSYNINMSKNFIPRKMDIISNADKKLIASIMNKNTNPTVKIEPIKTNLPEKKIINNVKPQKTKVKLSFNKPNILKNKINKSKITTNKSAPNFEPKENISPTTTKKENIWSKLKASVHLKDDGMRKDYEANKIKNEEAKKQKEMASNNISNKTKADLKHRFSQKQTVKNPIENKQITKQPTVTTIKPMLSKETVKKVEKTEPQNISTKTVTSDKKTVKPTQKITKIKPQKTKDNAKNTKISVDNKKNTLSENIKNKYNNFKNKYASKKQNKTAEKTNNNNVEKYIIINNSNSDSSRFVQTRIRNNARNYIPRYDYSVNDI